MRYHRNFMLYNTSMKEYPFMWVIVLFGILSMYMYWLDYMIN